jgi:transmembrane sensor
MKYTPAMDELLFENRIADLLLKYLREDLTDEENRVLQEWAVANNENSLLLEQLKKGELPYDNIERLNASKKKILDKVLEEIPELTQVSHPTIIWMRWLSAAVVMGLLFTGYWFFMREGSADDKQIAVAKTSTATDRNPASEGALLSLSDGAQILLDTVQNGALAIAGNDIVKEGNRLSYVVPNATANKELLNTISTPRGKQFQLQLPDGTIVYLNALSSVTFPMAFPGSERRIKVTGEAFFEVAHNKNKPFKVDVDGRGEVEVLGTVFAINSYSDEPVNKITLISGSIKVAAHNKQRVIQPGQQIQLTGGDDMKFIEHADLDEAQAFHKGMFYFKKTSLPAMFRQIAKWYDVDVEGTIPAERTITGEAPRNISLTRLIGILSLNDVHCRIEGRKLIVHQNK